MSSSKSSSNYIHPDFHSSFVNHDQKTASSSSQPMNCNWFLNSSQNETSNNNINKFSSKLTAMSELWSEAATNWSKEKEKREKEAEDDEERQRNINRRNSSPSSSATTATAGIINNTKRRNSRQQLHQQKGKEMNFDEDDAENKRKLLEYEKTRREGKGLSSSYLIDVLESDQTQDLLKKAKLANDDQNMMRTRRRVLSSPFEVETVKDIEEWANESSLQAQQNRTPLSTNRSSLGSAHSSSSSSTFYSSSVLSSSSLVVSSETIRWMRVAEKNLLLAADSSEEGITTTTSSSSSTALSTTKLSSPALYPDWINAIKNYSNALQSQLQFGMMPISQQQQQQSSSFSNNTNNNARDDDGFSISSEKKQQAPSSSSSSDHHQKQQQQQPSSLYSSKIANPNQKVVVSIILSNRAACRLAICDYDGALQDSNEALNFCQKLPSALVRLAYCLLLSSSPTSSTSNSSSGQSSSVLHPSVSAFINSSSGSTEDNNPALSSSTAPPLPNKGKASNNKTSSSSTLTTNSQKLLFKCDLVCSVMTDPNNNNNTNSFLPPCFFDTKALVEAANFMNEFENFRNEGELISSLQSLENAASAINSSTITTATISFTDPRFDLVKIEILSMSGAYEDAADEAAKLLSNMSSFSLSSSSSSPKRSGSSSSKQNNNNNNTDPASFSVLLADAWAFRGSCVFRATADGSSSNFAISCYRKAAQIYRQLHTDIGRIFTFSSPSVIGKTTSSSSSSGNNSNTHQQQHHYLLINSAKHTVIADSLQKYEKLEVKLSKFFDDYFSAGKKVSSSSSSLSAADLHQTIKVANEILTLDLLGHRIIRAFTLLRRAILFSELLSSQQQQGDMNTFSSTNNNYSTSSSSSSNSSSSVGGGVKNALSSRGIEDAVTALKLIQMDSSSSSSSSSSSNLLSSSSLLFTIALHAVKAKCNQHSFAYLRALEDIELALITRGEFERSCLNENNINNSESSSNSSGASSLLTRHPEIAKFTERKFLIELQELLKSQKFSYQQQQTNSNYYNHNNAEAMKKQQRFFERQREEATKGRTRYTQEDFDREWQDEEEKEKERKKRSSFFEEENNGKTKINNHTVIIINHYDILGVARNAETPTIVRAYRTAALKWHPDKWAGKSEVLQKQAEENFKMLNNAYLVLKDDIQRIKYDATL